MVTVSSPAESSNMAQSGRQPENGGPSTDKMEMEAELTAKIVFLERLCEIARRDGQANLAAMKRSASWRVTAPLRFLTDTLVAVCRHFAPAAFRPLPPRPASSLFASAKELERQRSAAPRPGDSFCVAVPLAGPSDERLAALRDSLLAQTFPAWELCVADASGSEEAAHHERILREKRADGGDRVRFVSVRSGESDLLSAAVGLSEAPLVLVLGQDDQLAPDALFRFAEALATAGNPAFAYANGLLVRDGFRFDESHAGKVVSVQPRPDFSLDSFRGHDFIGRAFAFRRELLNSAGGFHAEAGSAATTDLLFRLSESGGAPVRIAAPLSASATPLRPLVPDGASDMARVADARRAVEGHLARAGIAARIETPSRDRAFFRIRPPRPEPAPLVSILIPNRENPGVLETCVKSILSLTSYPNYEIVIVESGSSKPETFALYDRLAEDPRVSVVRFPKRPEEPFNYSRKCNFGAAQCRGDYLLLLNSDTEIIMPDWVDEMLGFAARPDVGVVGAMLLFGNGTVQHAGIVHRPGGLPDLIERRTHALSPGRMCRLLHVEEYQAITFACAMVRTSTWRDLDGLDESFAVAFNDVDFCYRVRERGLKVVWTPFAKLFHHESLVRGSDHVGPNRKRFLREIAHLRERWGALLAAPDPFFDDLEFTSIPRSR